MLLPPEGQGAARNQSQAGPAAEDRRPGAPQGAFEIGIAVSIPSPYDLHRVHTGGGFRARKPHGKAFPLVIQWIALS